MQGNDRNTRDLHEEVRQGQHQDRHAPTYPYLVHEENQRRKQQGKTPDDIQ